MEFEPERKCFTSIGFEDPRTEAGELLHPERVDAEAVATLKEELGPRGAAAQLQQSPSPAGGAIFKRDQIQFYKTAPRIRRMVQSWDCTFKETMSGSYVTGQTWGTFENGYYLLDQTRARMELSGTCKAIKAMSGKWTLARTKLVEAKANGHAVVDTLKKSLSGLVLVEPLGGKEARANAVEPLWESKSIYLPDPSIAPWINDFIEEVMAFPNASYDDQVDSMSQALTYLYAKNITLLRLAMQNARR